MSQRKRDTAPASLGMHLDKSDSLSIESAVVNFNFPLVSHLTLNGFSGDATGPLSTHFTPFDSPRSRQPIPSTGSALTLVSPPPSITQIDEPPSPHSSAGDASLPRNVVKDDGGFMVVASTLSRKDTVEVESDHGDEKGGSGGFFGWVWSAVVSVISAWTMITGAYCRWAVLLALAQMLILSIIESAVFTIVLHFAYSAFDNFSDRITLLFLLVYYSLYIVAQIFSFFLVWDAARRKNTAQIIAASLFNGCILLYSGVAIRQLVDIVEYKFDDGDGLAQRMWASAKVSEQMYHVRIALVLSAVAVAIMGLFVAVGAYVAYKVYQEIGWSIFQAHGASLEKRRMLRHFHFFMMLLKINIFFNVGIVVQSGAAIYFDALTTSSAANSFRTRQASAWSAGFALAVVAAFYYHLGASAARKASPWLMNGFLFLVTANMMGLVAGLVIVYRSSRFKVAQVDLTWFIIIQLLLNIATFLNAFVVYKDFARGLRDIIEVNATKFQSSPTIMSTTSTLSSHRSAPWRQQRSASMGSSLSVTVREGDPVRQKSVQRSKTFLGTVPVQAPPLVPRSVPVLD